MKKQYIVLISGVSLVLLFVVGVQVYKGWQIKKFGFLAANNASLFIREHSPTLGSDDAKVYLIKFTDPACETCSAMHPFVKQLMAIRYNPLHEGADYPVKILEAARKQGKLWETMEILYSTQQHWTSHHVVQPQKIWPLLSLAGLDVEKIRKDMNDPAIQERIKQDLADAKAMGVKKTPGFFVNGKPLTSFGSSQLRQLVESEIKGNY
jgi:protein-disulfide isomerase